MKSDVKFGITLVIIWIISFVIGACVAHIYHKHKPTHVNVTSPVEKTRIDTLYITIDNYKTKIKYIDSIKYDTIEKSYYISDSAAIELFYKLVSDR